MPTSPFAYYIITPLTDNEGVSDATGVTIDNDLYTLADATPRTATHKHANTGWTQEIEDAIETPTTGARAVFPSSDFTKYHRVTEKGVPAARRAALGLTTSAT